MADLFSTTYENFFTWHDYTNRRKSCKQADTIYEEPPRGDDIWLATESSSDAERMRAASLDNLKEFVNKLYRNRKYSTYQVCYCKCLHRKLDPGETSDFGNELLEYGNRLYSKNKPKILKPLPTSRKLYGYIRPSYVYTGLTEYEADINWRGYHVLANNAKRNKV